jgi:hypothetical protein
VCASLRLPFDYGESLSCFFLLVSSRAVLAVCARARACVCVCVHVPVSPVAVAVAVAVAVLQVKVTGSDCTTSQSSFDHIMPHNWQYGAMSMFDGCTKVTNAREAKESSAKAKAKKKEESRWPTSCGDFDFHDRPLWRVGVYSGCTCVFGCKIGWGAISVGRPGTWLSCQLARWEFPSHTCAEWRRTVSAVHRPPQR